MPPVASSKRVPAPERLRLAATACQAASGRNTGGAQQKPKASRRQPWYKNSLAGSRTGLGTVSGVRPAIGGGQEVFESGGVSIPNYTINSCVDESVIPRAVSSAANRF